MTDTIALAIYVALGSLVVFDLAERGTGRIPASIGLGALAVAAAALAGSGILFLFHPGWDTGRWLPMVGGPGAVLVLVLQFFIRIGPKGTGLVMLGLAALARRAALAKLASIRAGDYRGLKVVRADEKRLDSEMGRRYRATIASLRELLAAEDADRTWLEAQPLEYETLAEAERAAAWVNGVRAGLRARRATMRRLADEARRLERELGLHLRPAGHKVLLLDGVGLHLLELPDLSPRALERRLGGPYAVAGLLTSLGHPEGVWVLSRRRGPGAEPIAAIAPRGGRCARLYGRALILGQAADGTPVGLLPSELRQVRLVGYSGLPLPVLRFGGVGRPLPEPGVSAAPA